MGRYSEAEPLVVRALAIAEQQLGVKHPTTVIFRNNLQSLQGQKLFLKPWQCLLLIVLRPMGLPIWVLILKLAYT